MWSNRFSQGKPSRRGSSDDAMIRRIGWKLSMLTAALLFLLVSAMAASVYFKSKGDLLQPIQHLVRTRASDERVQILRPNSEANEAFGGRHGPPPRHGQPGPPKPENHGPSIEPSPGGVFVYDTDRTLKLVRASIKGPRGTKLPSVRAAREAIEDDEASFTTIHTGQGTFLLYTLPFGKQDSPRGVIQTAASESEYIQSLAALLQTIILVGVIGLLAAGIISLIVSRRALAPIRRALEHQRNFVADAAHELRTPLTIIRMASELNIADGDPEEQQRAEMTYKQAMHLSRLVGDLSLLARADTGTLDFEDEILDLHDLASEVVSDIDVLSEEHGVRLVSQLSPDVFVWGDRTRLQQVLLILLDNALKHTPAGGAVTISLEKARRDAVVKVIDSGPGIPPPDLPHVFERFYQSDEARSGEGTGLGLAIAQSIVQAERGHIHAANAPSGGAVFTVSFPLTAAPPTPIPPQEAASSVH